MDNKFEELNTLYRSELNKFLSKVDFEELNRIKEIIISSICNYFDDGYKNLIAYDKRIIEEKIEEVFNYGISRTRATISEVGFIKYDGLDTFDSKSRENSEMRNQFMSKFDSENPSNNFYDLEERVSILISEYLIKRNYDNQNYERYHFKIKTDILKYLANQKKKMLDVLKLDLEKQNQELEKVILVEYKSIITSIDGKIDNSSYENLALPPILDDFSNSGVEDTPLDFQGNNSDLTLPGDFLK